MVKNDFVKDVKMLGLMEGKTMTALGEQLEVRQNTISTIIRGKIVSQRYVDICDALGYDIVIKYVKDGKEYDFT